MPPQGQPTGALSRATISLPAIDAMQTMGKVAQAGKAAGARQAVNAVNDAAGPGSQHHHDKKRNV